MFGKTKTDHQEEFSTDLAEVWFGRPTYIAQNCGIGMTWAERQKYVSLSCIYSAE